jgi:hypothetical protein
MRRPVSFTLCLFLFSCGRVYLRAAPDASPVETPTAFIDAMAVTAMPADAAIPDAGLPDASPPDARVCKGYTVPLRKDPPSYPDPLEFQHGTMDGLPASLYRSYGGTGVSDHRIDTGEMVTVHWDVPVTGISISLSDPVGGFHFLVTADGTDLYTFTVEPDYGFLPRYEVPGFYDSITVTSLNGNWISMAQIYYQICL